MPYILAIPVTPPPVIVHVRALTYPFPPYNMCVRIGYFTRNIFSSVRCSLQECVFQVLINIYVTRFLVIFFKAQRMNATYKISRFHIFHVFPKYRTWMEKCRSHYREFCSEKVSIIIRLAILLTVMWNSQYTRRWRTKLCKGEKERLSGKRSILETAQPRSVRCIRMRCPLKCHRQPHTQPTLADVPFVLGEEKCWSIRPHGAYADE